MASEFLQKFNWVDILVILVSLRALYIGLKRGIVVEFFKLLGVLFATVISLHYYTWMGDFLASKSPLPVDLADFISLLFLPTGIILLFKFIRDGFNVLIKTEAQPILDRWGGFIFSAIRALILSSLIIIILFTSNITYVKKSIKDSFSQAYLLNLTPGIYSGCFENLVVKFFPQEQLNKALFESLEAAVKD